MKHKGNDHSEDLGIDMRIILDRMFGNRIARCGLESCGLGYGSVASSCQHGNESLDSIKGLEFLH